jgi:hypothetical protein
VVTGPSQATVSSARPLNRPGPAVTSQGVSISPPAISVIDTAAGMAAPSSANRLADTV